MQRAQCKIDVLSDEPVWTSARQDLWRRIEQHDFEPDTPLNFTRRLARDHGWSLEHARQKNPKDATVNRMLARLYEKRGNFSQAIGLWELVRKEDPQDVEAQHKSTDLAASDTIARGNYEAVVAKAAAGESDTGEHEAAVAAKDTPTAVPAPLSLPDQRLAREAAALRTRRVSPPAS